MKINLSPGRGLVFFMVALPIGFILSALGFVATGREIAAPALATCALVIAAIAGAIAAFWKTAR